MPFKGINWKERFPELLELGQQGKSLVELGDHFGVTRQRIKQVYQKYGVDPKSVGVPLRAQRNREQRARDFFTKWGDLDQDLYIEKRRKFLAKRNNAKRVGEVFTIGFSEVEWPTHCPILGMELDFFAEGRQENSVSFDCIEPTKGYTLGNTAVMSWRANRIKNDGTAEEHKLIADFIEKACA